jgi:hypothetical protein
MPSKLASPGDVSTHDPAAAIITTRVCSKSVERFYEPGVLTLIR